MSSDKITQLNAEIAALQAKVLPNTAAKDLKKIMQQTAEKNKQLVEEHKGSKNEQDKKVAELEKKLEEMEKRIAEAEAKAKPNQQQQVQPPGAPKKLKDDAFIPLTTVLTYMHNKKMVVNTLKKFLEVAKMDQATFMKNYCTQIQKAHALSFNKIGFTATYTNISKFLDLDSNTTKGGVWVKHLADKGELKTRYESLIQTPANNADKYLSALLRMIIEAYITHGKSTYKNQPHQPFDIEEAKKHMIEIIPICAKLDGARLVANHTHQGAEGGEIDVKKEMKGRQAYFQVHKLTPQDMFTNKLDQWKNDFGQIIQELYECISGELAKLEDFVVLGASVKLTKAMWSRMYKGKNRPSLERFSKYFGQNPFDKNATEHDTHAKWLQKLDNNNNKPPKDAHKEKRG